MTKYIIGTISDMDVPQTPQMKGNRSLSAYLCGLSYEKLQADRKELLSTQPEDIRALADHVEAILKTGVFCVVGGETKIREHEQLFDVVEDLFPAPSR